MSIIGNNVYGTCKIFKQKPLVVEAFQAPMAMEIDGLSLVPGDWAVIQPDGHCVKFSAEEFNTQFDAADGEVPTRLARQKAVAPKRTRSPKGTRKPRGMAVRSVLLTDPPGVAIGKTEVRTEEHE